MIEMQTALIKTNDGAFTAHFSPKGLAALSFPGDPGNLSSAEETPPGMCSTWHELTSQAVRRVLAGKSIDELPPLDISAGTNFQRRVWEAMGRIRTGQTMSYGEIAEQIGAPKAVRAVGGACGANPIPLLIPCHRVLAANGRLGGFSGGLSWKMLLLKREMIACLLPAANASKPFSQRSLPG